MGFENVGLFFAEGRAQSFINGLELLLRDFDGLAKARDFSVQVGFAQPHPNDASARIIHEESRADGNARANSYAFQALLI